MAMEYHQEKMNGNRILENGHATKNHTLYQPAIKVSLAWLDLRVFYARINKCEINDSTPEFLTLNHIPLNRDTLLEVNGVRSSYYSDGVSILLRRDRLDKKSEEVTFVSTDSLRMTGSVKFEVFHKDVLVLSGVLELCSSKGLNGESKTCFKQWKMNCETELVAGNGFLKGKQNLGMESDPPAIEVCLAGSYGGNPIILTKHLQLSFRKKQTRKAMLESIPEYGDTENQNETSSALPLLQDTDDPNAKPENEEGEGEYGNLNSGMEYYYFQGEDGELTWFNAGVRVGVGIGLSVCLGLGIGVGLLVRTYQGTTRNFRRRIL